MMGRNRHIPTDRLTALAFVARVPETGSSHAPDDLLALEHVSRCSRCAARLTQLTAQAGQLRDFACAEADDVFDDAMLEAQRTRILDRLAHLGQTARVISFPRRTRDAMPVSSNGRRWISVAAAAGLIIGLLAGQVLHFVPATALPSRDDDYSVQALDRGNAPGLVPTSTSLPALSDDELMEEVEAAVQLRRVYSLRAIDALTPTAADLLALGR